MRVLVLATTVSLSSAALAEEPPVEYVPAPASAIPGYSETKLPCRFVRGIRDTRGTVSSVEGDDPDAADFVECDPPHGGLGELPLRELSIRRNTIYARYGWAGFRKPWLREHFQKQPWYKPDPKFSLKRLSTVDHENAQLIAQVELSLRSTGPTSPSRPTCAGSAPRIASSWDSSAAPWATSPWMTVSESRPPTRWTRC